MATTVNRAVALTDAVDVCCPSVLAEPLAETDAEDLARVFAALSDPVRLRLLSLVAQAGEICSCDLQDPLGKAQPTVSHHTKVLAEAGLLAGGEARPVGVVADRARSDGGGAGRARGARLILR